MRTNEELAGGCILDRRRFQHPRRHRALEPIVYTVRVPKPDSHAAKIEAVFPTGGRRSFRS